MQTLSRFGFLTNNTHYFHFPRFLPISHTQNQLFKKTSESFALRTSAPSGYPFAQFFFFFALCKITAFLLFSKYPLQHCCLSWVSVSEVAEDDVLQMFLKERELNGDFISKVSDLFWQRGVANAKYVDADTVYVADTPQQAEQVYWISNLLNFGFIICYMEYFSLDLSNSLYGNVMVLDSGVAFVLFFFHFG